MTKGYYVLRNKIPVPVESMMEWGKEIENIDNRRVAFDKLSDKINVSTVFLGIDHQWGKGEPLLFETLVFGGTLDGEMRRYSTWEQAEQGHREVVEQVRGSLSPTPPPDISRK